MAYHITFHSGEQFLKSDWSDDSTSGVIGRFSYDYNDRKTYSTESQANSALADLLGNHIANSDTLKVKSE